MSCCAWPCFEPTAGLLRRRMAPSLERSRQEDVTVLRMENVGIVVDDLGAAPAFFVELGLKLLAMR